MRKLRAAFDDPLLVSPGRNARLTDRAEVLAGPLALTLGELDSLLKPAAPFDPMSEWVHLVITTADYVMYLLAPILSEICAREAPHVVLEFTRRGIYSAEELASVDFVIAPRAFGHSLGKKVGALPLWRDEMVCIAGADNGAIRDRITPMQFQASRYVAFRREVNPSHEVLTLLQPTSRLETAPVCTVPNFLALGAIVQKSNCLALVPRRAACELSRIGKLHVVEIAYPNKKLFIDAYWSLANSNRRGRAWFRKVLARAASSLG